MHVQGSSIPRASRPPFAAAVVAMFASVVGVAHAVEFDEKMKAPMAKDAAELRVRAQTHFERDAPVRSLGMEALIRNRSLSQERFDVIWSLQRSIDAKRPVGDLSAHGIVDRGDGSYGVDLSAYPQWSDPAARLSGMLPVLDPGALDTELTRRGMRPEDLVKLRNYLATHNVKAAMAVAALPIGVSFSRLVKKYDKIKRPVPDSLVFDYIYQRERATTEAQRAWAESLCNAIGPSAVRIIASYFDEMKTTAVWSPGDTRPGIDGLLANLRLPDFESRATAETKEIAP